MAEPSHADKKRAHDQNVKRNYEAQRKAGASHDQADRAAREQAHRTCERLDRTGWGREK